jgi:hypothetical protein
LKEFGPLEDIDVKPNVLTMYFPRTIKAKWFFTIKRPRCSTNYYFCKSSFLKKKFAIKKIDTKEPNQLGLFW